jgi:NAD(P)-dependent dehydrogenase (short-subunit alcohol dehydrogenase family)
VNSIHPGLILTPMLGVVTREELQPLVEATPLKRGAEPEEVGWCVVFLASDEASSSSPVPSLWWTAATPLSRRLSRDARRNPQLVHAVIRIAIL